MLILDIYGGNGSSHQSAYHYKFSRHNSKYFAIYPPSSKLAQSSTPPSKSSEFQLQSVPKSA